jgi:hypothetical protein
MHHAASCTLGSNLPLAAGCSKVRLRPLASVEAIPAKDGFVRSLHRFSPVSAQSQKLPLAQGSVYRSRD